MKLDQPLNLNFNVDEELCSSIDNGKITPNQSAGHTLVNVENDETLKDAVEHWLKGDWKYLVKLDNSSLPDTVSRRYLAILAAAGHQYLDDVEAETRCINLATKWGATKRELETMLLSGIFNRLGRASVLSEDYIKAIKYFMKALNTTIFSVDNANQWLEKRVRYQLVDMSEYDLKKTLDTIQSG